MIDMAESSKGRKGPPPAVLLVISLAAAAAAVALARGPRPGEYEVIVSRMGAEESAGLTLNTGGTVDAIADPRAVPRVGWRYRVLTEAPARTQADAVARIGGRVTFVAGARPGEVRLVEVTAVKATTVDAVPIGPAESAAGALPPSTAPSVHAMTGTVDGVGSRGDGRLRVDGLTVYVPGAATGDRIVFEITRRDEKYGVGRLIEKLPKDAPPEPSAGTPGPVGPANLATGVVDGVGSKGDGRVSLDGIPIYVPGTAPGERVAFEVVRKGDRYGVGRLVEKLAATNAAAAPVVSEPATASPIRLAVGDIHEVTITEQAHRNPERDGVARIGGRAVIVPGVQTGRTVRIRITEVRERVAFGEVVDGAAGRISP